MQLRYITTFSATSSPKEVILDDTQKSGAETEAYSDSAAYSTEASGHSTEESEGIGALGLDPFAIGAQALTFLVLFYIIKKFALDGIVKNLDKRHKDINRGLHLTAEMDKAKAELEVKVEAELKKARKEGDLIIAEAHAETGKMIQEAESKANHKADEILRVAEGKIERDISEARQGLKTEMASLISEATEAILGQKLDASGDKKLVDDYLKGAMK